VQGVSVQVVATTWQKTAVASRQSPTLRDLPPQIIEPSDVTLDGISQVLVILAVFSQMPATGKRARSSASESGFRLRNG